MSKIPTAEEFLQEHAQISHFYDDTTNRMVCFSDDVQKAIIEFAKLHCEACKKEISEKAELTDFAYEFLQEGALDAIDKDSIINAYPLTNIK